MLDFNFTRLLNFKSLVNVHHQTKKTQQIVDLLGCGFVRNITKLPPIS